jgi:hypothetical protein
MEKGGFVKKIFNMLNILIIYTICEVVNWDLNKKINKFIII